jgi:hypothetical protein
MKKLLLLSLLTFAMCSLSAQRKQEVGLGYVYADPIGSMGYNIAHANGFTVNYGLLTLEDRLAVGLDLNYAWYGRDKSRQEYLMDDGSSAPMDIIVNNSFAVFSVYGRWYLKTEGPLLPFITAKLGYAYFATDLNIYDPDDFDHCEPVDTDQLYEDGSFVASGGAGLMFDLSKIFGRLEKNTLHLEASYNLTQGGKVSYMNADAQATPQHHHADESGDVTAEFVDTQTQIVHKHHIGYLYKNPLQMSELKFGLAVRFGQ